MPAFDETALLLCKTISFPLFACTSKGKKKKRRKSMRSLYYAGGFPDRTHCRSRKRMPNAERTAKESEETRRMPNRGGKQELVMAREGANQVKSMMAGFSEHSCHALCKGQGGANVRDFSAHGKMAAILNRFEVRQAIALYCMANSE